MLIHKQLVRYSSHCSTIMMISSSVPPPSASGHCCRQSSCLLRELRHPHTHEASSISSEVFLASITDGASGLLYFAEDMQQHDDAHVKKRQDQHGLGGDLQTRGFFLEEGKLISWTVLWAGGSICCVLSVRGSLRSGHGTLPCLLFLIHFTHSFSLS